MRDPRNGYIENPNEVSWDLDFDTIYTDDDFEDDDEDLEVWQE